MTRTREYGLDTPFEAWSRNNKNLDSRIYKVTNCDVDHNWHVYSKWDSREYQCFMEIEGKAFMQTMTSSQYDTLGIKQQFLQRGIKKVCTRETDGFDNVKSRRRVWCYCFGVHYLRFSGKDPGDSDVILWNHKEISLDTLEKILRFDIHPDTYQPITSKWYNDQIPIE